jgi:hypothetical protein
MAQTGDAHGLKIPFEEGASGIRILRLPIRGFATDVQRAPGP